MSDGFAASISPKFMESRVSPSRREGHESEQLLSLSSPESITSPSTLESVSTSPEGHTLSTTSKFNISNSSTATQAVPVQGIKWYGLFQTPFQGHRRPHVRNFILVPTRAHQTNKAVSTHLEQAHRDKPCTYGDATCLPIRDLRSLRRHLDTSSAHSGHQFHCRCGYTIGRKDNFTTHMRKDNCIGDLPYVCVCTYTSKCRETFSAHLSPCGRGQRGRPRIKPQYETVED